jgi:3-oxoacyl-[acyl-carrier protein] reductase
MELELKSKTAIVTGGAGSIGQEICRVLAAEGVRIVVCDYRKEEAGTEIVRQIKDQGGQAIYCDTNIIETASVDHLLKVTAETFGGLHFLINCAGVAFANYVWETPESEWDTTLDINLKGIFLTCRAASPLMIAQRFGRIVNIASLVSHQGSFKHAHYCASKAGVIGFTKSLARELGEHNVCANCISPGRIKSTMEQERQNTEQAAWIAQTPLKRMGMPLDIAKGVVYLCSSLGSFVTGETLNINGGIWIG